MASTQDAISQGVRELGEHARSAFTEPSVTPYYLLAGGAIAASIGFLAANKRDLALFFGLWPPTIIGMAILGRISRSLTQRVIH
jgi:hypothetical protein